MDWPGARQFRQVGAWYGAWMNDMPLLTMNRRFALTAMAAAGVLGTLPAAAAELPRDTSATARQLVRWATETGDHQGLPFAVIDKPAARIHVFSAQGQWLSSAPVLLGAALGLGSPPLAVSALLFAAVVNMVHIPHEEAQMEAGTATSRDR